MLNAFHANVAKSRPHWHLCAAARQIRVPQELAPLITGHFRDTRRIRAPRRLQECATHKLHTAARAVDAMWTHYNLPPSSTGRCSPRRLGANHCAGLSAAGFQTAICRLTFRTSQLPCLRSGGFGRSHSQQPPATSRSGDGEVGDVGHPRSPVVVPKATMVAPPPTLAGFIDAISAPSMTRKESPT